ncbi:MAG: tRNA pseudouridine(38-40) synthase TruA [Verrucomicrobiae bacterium]|nr:tRNA pseudouridine(38-40) synthase TruA [Verrucomicrobiae bacterium]
MSRFRITIAYDGQPFAGWQKQLDATTVQGLIERALSKVSGCGEGERICVHGSGRTDAGVHALGQVAHFDAREGASLDSDAWRRALNVNLPPTVRIMDCAEAPSDFHARFDACRKTYAYHVHHAPVLPPHAAGRAWHVFGKLDYAVLEAGLASLSGQHDFTAFAANRGDASDQSSRVRTIFDAWLSVDGDRLILRFSGDGFLYKMVRLLTGGLVRCAQGRERIEWFTALLHRPTAAAKAPYCAPADGLYLERVDYALDPAE